MPSKTKSKCKKSAGEKESRYQTEEHTGPVKSEDIMVYSYRDLISLNGKRMFQECSLHAMLISSTGDFQLPFGGAERNVGGYETLSMKANIDENDLISSNDGYSKRDSRL